MTPEEQIIDKFKKAVIKKATSGIRSDNIHVTSLTSPCLRRTYYSRKFPKKEPTFEEAGILLFGTMVHENIALDKVTELKLCADIRNKTPIHPSKINKENLYDCIEGSMDDLMEIDGTVYILDKKTFSSKKNWIPKEPNSDYVMQINIYSMLTKYCYNMDIKKGAILYMDTATRFAELRCFTFDLNDIELTRQQMLEKLDELKKDKMPNRYISWRCGYCSFSDICNPKEALDYETNKKRQ
jgi:CRISPR/Cas system-associated exonuclease Cas4 (RecB family)